MGNKQFLLFPNAISVLLIRTGQKLKVDLPNFISPGTDKL